MSQQDREQCVPAPATRPTLGLVTDFLGDSCRGPAWLGSAMKWVLLVFPLAILSAEDDLSIVPREPTPREKAAEVRAFQTLVDGLRETDPETFRSAAQGLAARGSERALRPLQTAYAQVEGVRRRVLLQAIGSLKQKALKDWLFALSMAEPFLGLRRAAAEALVVTLGRSETAALYGDLLLKPAGALRPSGRQRAVQLLAHVGGTGSAEKIRGLLEDGDPSVVMEACDALAVMHDLDAVASLMKVLEARHPEAAPAAQEALTRITGEHCGGNLVKWRQWLQARQVAREQDAQTKADDYGGGATYIPDYGRPYDVPLAETPVDFVIVYDTTGSLARIWPEVSVQVDAILGEMAQRCSSLRLGTIRYRSTNTDRSRYSIEPLPLTRDLQRARDNILDASFGGGSGGLHLGMMHAIGEFQWRACARKAVLVVGDITPVGDGLNQCLHVIRDARTLDRIYFNTLFVRSLHGDEHRPIYGQMAVAGAGRFYEYDRAWKYLVDWSAEKPDPKTFEPYVETLKKWMTPLVRAAPSPSKPK